MEPHLGQCKHSGAKLQRGIIVANSHKFHQLLNCKMCNILLHCLGIHLTDIWHNYDSCTCFSGISMRSHQITWGLSKFCCSIWWNLMRLNTTHLPSITDIILYFCCCESNEQQCNGNKSICYESSSPDSTLCHRCNMTRPHMLNVLAMSNKKPLQKTQKSVVVSEWAEV